MPRYDIPDYSDIYGDPSIYVKLTYENFDHEQGELLFLMAITGFRLNDKQMDPGSKDYFKEAVSEYLMANPDKAKWYGIDQDKVITTLENRLSVKVDLHGGAKVHYGLLDQNGDAADEGWKEKR